MHISHQVRIINFRFVKNLWDKNKKIFFPSPVKSRFWNIHPSHMKIKSSAINIKTVPSPPPVFLKILYLGILNSKPCNSVNFMVGICVGFYMILLCFQLTLTVTTPSQVVLFLFTAINSENCQYQWKEIVSYVCTRLEKQ